MAKRGALSIEEKQLILKTIQEADDFDDCLDALAQDMDRTTGIIQKYVTELRELGLIIEDGDQNDVEPETNEMSEAEEEMREIRRNHLREIVPSKKGATTGTKMLSEYVDEENKKRSQKPTYGKYASNVMKIIPDKK